MPGGQGLDLGMRVLLASLLLLGACGGEEAAVMEAAADPEAQAVEAVVVEMNTAASRRNLAGMMACFADGSVQLQLEAQHQGFGSPELVQDLAKSWQTITPVLFTVAKSYQREVSDFETRVDGKLATVWCAVRTETVMPESDAPIVRNFRESYWLKKDGEDWKIIAMVNSRGTGATVES